MPVGRLTLITAPAAEPISEDEAKLHLRIETVEEYENNNIARWIAAARRQAETATVRRLINSTWDIKYDCFPASSGATLVLPYPPLSSVTSVKYIDTDGTEQTWGSSNYTVDSPSGDNPERGRIYPVYAGLWPTDVRPWKDVVTVRYVAGYGTAGSDVPEDILNGMYLLIGHYSENREAITSGKMAELPMGVQSLWSNYRSEY